MTDIPTIVELWSNCVIFAYFAQLRTLETKKWGPAKDCSILLGIGRNPTADQSECGFWIVGIFV